MPAGARCLSELLPLNEGLQLLDVSHNGHLINDVLSSCLFKAASLNPRIHTFRGVQGGFGPLCAQALPKVLEINKTLRSLDLGSNSLGYPQGLAPLMGPNFQGFKSVAAALKLNTFLTSLDLSRNQLDDGAATELAAAARGHASLRVRLASVHNVCLNCNFMRVRFC